MINKQRMTRDAQKSFRKLPALCKETCAAFQHGALRASGFTIIEISLVIVAVGLLIPAALQMYKISDLAHKKHETEETMVDVQEALENFAVVNGRYPCPAIMDAPLDTAEFGKEAGMDCRTVPVTDLPRPAGRDGRMVRIGALPVRALGLDDLQMTDAWRNRITYAVTEDYTVPGVAEPILDENEGAIGITDSNGNDVSMQSGNAIYTLMASGGDIRGAVSLSGNLQATCADENTMAGQNCDNDDADFRATTNRNYSEDDNKFTNQIGFKANAIATGWTVGTWSPCTCAHETQTRTVECLDTWGNPAPGQCPAGSEPANSQSCPMPPCDWAQGPWAPCSVACGGGTRSKTVDCVRDDNINTLFELPGTGDTLRGASLCTSARPANSQACNTQACPEDGVCGSAHAGTTPYTSFASLTAAQSCTGGTRVNFLDTPAAINWRCEGIGGGSSVDCSAPRKYTGRSCGSCPFGSFTTNYPNFQSTYCRVPDGYRGKTTTGRFDWVYKKSSESVNTGVACSYGNISHANYPAGPCIVRFGTAVADLCPQFSWTLEATPATPHRWRSDNYPRPTNIPPPRDPAPRAELDAGMSEHYMHQSNETRATNRPCAPEDVGKYFLTGQPAGYNGNSQVSGRWLRCR